MCCLGGKAKRVKKSQSVSVVEGGKKAMIFCTPVKNGRNCCLHHASSSYISSSFIQNHCKKSILTFNRLFVYQYLGMITEIYLKQPFIDSIVAAKHFWAYKSEQFYANYIIFLRGVLPLEELPSCILKVG